jgi:putative transposase
MRIRDIAMSRPRFGYERIHVLLRREGWDVNLKRVHRLYCLEGLQVRMRVRRKKRMSLHRVPAPAPTAQGQRWSMDFVHDQLVTGQPFRVLTVVDNWSRESPVLEVGFRLTGGSVVEALSAGWQDGSSARMHNSGPRHRIYFQGTGLMGLGEQGAA